MSTVERSKPAKRRGVMWIPALMAGMLLFLIPFGASPAGPLVQLFGLAHLLFFAGVAWWLSGRLDLARTSFGRQALIVGVTILCLGAAIEWVQPLFGRGASWRDLGIDVLGGLLGLVFGAKSRHSLPRHYVRCAQAVLLAVAAVAFFRPAVTLWDMWQASRQFPVLGDFETRFEAGRWSQGKIHEGLARRGRRSLRVVLGTDRYAGTTLQRSFGDWRGYSVLAFSLYNPDVRPLRITVSIRDQEHFQRGGEYQDRFNRGFTLAQGWNDIAIPVADIQSAPASRTLDLSRLREVVIFTSRLQATREIYLDHVRLIR